MARMKKDDPDMKETIIRFNGKLAYQLEMKKEEYIWEEQDLQLENKRTLHTTVTVPESFLCDFICRARMQSCNDTDSRGIRWATRAGQVARQPCPDPLPGYARYILSYLVNRFEGILS